MPSLKPLLVVAGIGQGGGTGGATARAFAKEGYSIALLARGADSLKSLEEELKASGADAASFPIPSYEHKSVQSAFEAIRARYPSSEYSLRAALYNAGHGVWKPFLDITPDDVKAVTQTNIEGAFAFSHEVVSEFKKNEIDETNGKRGALIFTGATASIRGNTTTSAFAAGKFALRALSQSLAKEFGKENIHVAHAIIDGGIVTPQGRERFNNPPKYDNEDQRLSPEAIASAYVYLAKQERSAWTWELDLRPAHEKW
ncbi:hypothetical protein GYMLUDRAFT_74851 [Collybiopsis luxurians FD-317 M1]|uniref:NAD(P)-binding protein n=1 Tax=Collybiopsis luxurians FD-317 M1 TaxID=944289 RepID=A0A0D0BT84_9AGAR|nr:hypothetical protein GYMLUDRAFT_74851 [Collybiopsis luxurians FD-317 M1]